MGNKWIIDVLADLKAFAEKNDLPLLADQLGQTADVAAAEIIETLPTAPLSVVGKKHEIGVIS